MPVNQVAMEMLDILMGNVLMHEGRSKRDGAPIGSGRYPLGSGENPYQHGSGASFLRRIDELKKQGMSEKEIAEYLGMTTTQLRAQRSLARSEEHMALMAQAESLSAQGLSATEIGRIMGKNESSIRALLAEAKENKSNQLYSTVETLKNAVDTLGMVDVGAGVEAQLGISKEKMRQALIILQDEGYYTYKGRVKQVTNPGKYTTMTILCPPDTPYKTVINERTGEEERRTSQIFDYGNIHQYNELGMVSTDSGESYHKALEYPASLDSSRLQIRYADDPVQSGRAMDGVVEIRRGCKDLSLGDSRYAQVRILVDGTHYIKGMAIYSDDLPDGVDVRFNTNKDSSVPALGPKGNTVLKQISNDPSNPFKSLIKQDGQSYYDDPNGSYTDPTTGKKQSLSLINKTREEGEWGEWSKELPSQFLSKQDKELIKKQLNLSIADKKEEYDEISKLTNPTVKKNLLMSFAGDCDSTAVKLSAASLPGQQYQVLVPVTSMKDNEVYAPNFENGSTVALVRFPHAGTFEIPVLKVNNNNKEAKKLLGTDPTAADAVGVNSNVTAKLSGADFDGDTVLVIPCNSPSSKVKITSKDTLRGLKDFDPTLEYGGRPEGSYKKLTKANTQTEMGKISNLITDMTVQGATDEEMARAVKHSMVIIDAEKHDLDYKASERENRIDQLKRKYQTHTDNPEKYGGASTLLSKASSEERVAKTVGSPMIDKETGMVSYKEDPNRYYNTAKVDRKADYTNATIKISKKGKTYAVADGDDSQKWLQVTSKTTNSDGTPLYKDGSRVAITVETQERKQSTTKMANTTDARTLVSTTASPAEMLYAEYANRLKALGNEARKEAVNTKEIKYNASAKATYSDEVASLDSKLRIAQQNAPKERQAQYLANSRVNALVDDNPSMTKEEIKKAGQRELTAARTQVGASHQSIDITDKEWEAIQAGAISPNKLNQILNHTDQDKVREKAMPKQQTGLSTAQINRIKALSAAGYSLKEIEKAMNLSESQVKNVLYNK